MVSAVLLNCWEKARASSRLKVGNRSMSAPAAKWRDPPGQHRGPDFAVVGQGVADGAELVEHRLVDGVDLSAVEPDDGDPCGAVAFELYY